MNRGSRMLLLLALGAGLLAAVLVFVALNNSGDSGSSNTSAPETTAAVVVAKQDIAVGTEIKDDMLKVVQVSPDLLIRNAFSDTSAVVGQKARVAIVSGEQVSSTKVGVQSKGEGLNQVVPPGMRGVAIDVAELTAVGGNLLPGHKVDVLGAFRIKKAPGLAPDEHILRVQTILQNVEVLSVAQNAQEPVPASDAAAKDATKQSETSGQLPKNVEKEPHAGTVTVALAPDQVQQLISAQQVAERVWLDMRPFGEDQTPELPSYDVIVVD